MGEKIVPIRGAVMADELAGGMSHTSAVVERGAARGVVRLHKALHCRGDGKRRATITIGSQMAVGAIVTCQMCEGKGCQGEAV